jgi:hypothetical protein
LSDTDDGREKTLRVDKSELDDDTLRLIEGKAAVSRDDARGDMHGQASLTDAEKKRLDFTETTVPEARTAKASLLAEGVSDWTAHFDPTLTTSEMADRARSTQASGGERLDSADTQRARDRQGADMFRQVQSQRGKRAREGCEEGFDEACDQLVEEHGFSRAEAEALVEGRQPAQGGRGVTADGGLVDTTVLRASAPGTFLRQPPQPADDAPGYRNGSTGRFVGYEIDEYENAKRSPESGRISTLGKSEPVPRSEAISRWGRPDGIDGDPTPDREQAKREALFEFEPMSRTDETTARASAFDVSINPENEPRNSAVADGLGGVKFSTGAGYRETDRPEEEQRPPETALKEQAGALGDDPFEFGADVGGNDMFTDDRDMQASFDVGIDAGATRDRDGKVAGSAGFEDRRDELQGSMGGGEQAGLFEQEVDVGGDGQTDLFGGNASETTGAEYRI